ncbi:sulfotransferase domain-containing protein [Natroniella sp. ANB-PHB2]|uniref:sulfotransferase domain-containing protein n=1 Tax=Natroniella sp. ANB-PHB2 TaxID=3384444 RepID=UPI0038D415C7
MKYCILQCGYPKSGNYLTYKIVSELLKKNNIFKSLSISSGRRDIIDKFYSEYKLFPEHSELDMLQIVDGEYKLKFPHPELRYHSVFLELLLKNSTLIWTHELAEKIINREFKDVTHRIYILRDGRDVVNSLIHFSTTALQRRRKSEYKIDSAEVLYSKMNIFKKYVSDWANHVNSYLKNKEKFKIVRFEKLINNKSKVVEELADYLGLDIKKKDIEDIVYKTGFKEMAKKASNHLRKGKKGDWDNYFTDEHKRVFKEIAGEELIALNYEEDYDW